MNPVYDDDFAELELEAEQIRDELEIDYQQDIVDIADQFKSNIKNSTSIIGIFINEWDQRTNITNEYCDGFNVILQLFFCTEFKVKKECWCCKNECIKYINCKNNHTDVLCWDCVYDTIMHNNSLKCGICRTPIKIEKHLLNNADCIKFSDLNKKFYYKFFDLYGYTLDRYSEEIYPEYTKIIPDYDIWFKLDEFSTYYFSE